jgi:hypothetical protein
MSLGLIGYGWFTDYCLSVSGYTNSFLSIGWLVPNCEDNKNFYIFPNIREKARADAVPGIRPRLIPGPEYPISSTLPGGS